MSLNRIIIILSFFLFLIVQTGRAKDYLSIFHSGNTVVDSIVKNAVMYAPMYEKIVQDYRADLYIKGHLDIPKKNFTFRYVPKMFKLQKGVTEYLIESFSEIHYTAPNIYDRKLIATYGTTYGGKFQATMFEYFHVNVYSQTLLHDRLLSPLAKNGPKYYKYRLDSIIHNAHSIDYKIRFIPKTKSDQLVGGWMLISDDVWSVREIRFSGRSGLFTFENLLKMGSVGDPDEFLPVEYELNAIFSFLGNIVDGTYSASLNYTEIELYDDGDIKNKREKKYDLTDSYTLLCDTNAFRRDSVFFDSIRPITLNDNEQKLYSDYAYRKDTVSVVIPKRNKVFWGSVGDFLLNDININLPSVGRVRCSPIINPLLLSYSKSNGFSWRQDFRYNRLFHNDKLLRIVPRIGYNFTRKEFYWSMTTDFDYLPQKQGRIHFSMGNGNRIYSSDVLEDLKAIPDSLFDFNQIHLEYFHDLYFNLRHSIEIVNGLNLSVGASVHRRTPVKTSTLVPIDPEMEVPGEIVDKVKKAYVSFAPRLRLDWTPGLYYYMNGKRKINLKSNFPTFSVDYERGIKGVFKSTGVYERIEFDIQHQINLHLMRNIFYRVGVGFFTNQEEMYFVDFGNFSRNNLPTGWNDDIGGVFHLLDGRWYNSSNKYARAHFTYEAPFIFMRHLMKYTRYVQNERLYFSGLVVPHLSPYIEVGYGVGTHVFDFGVFIALANWQFNQIGCKFTFELFNR